MSLKDRLQEQGWAEIKGHMYATNTRTGERKVYDRDTRLISPNGKTTYRPSTKVMTSHSSDETVEIVD